MLFGCKVMTTFGSRVKRSSQHQVNMDIWRNQQSSKAGFPLLSRAASRALHMHVAPKWLAAAPLMTSRGAHSKHTTNTPTRQPGTKGKVQNK